MARVCQQVRRDALLHHASAVEDQQAIDAPRRQREVVRDQQQPHAALGDQFPQQFQDLHPQPRIQGRGGLVGDQQFRLGGERHRDQRPLALSAGELVRIGAGLPLLQADARQQRQRALAGARAVRREAVQADRLHHLRQHALQRVQRRQRLLEHHRDTAAAQAAPVVLVEREQLSPVQGDAAGGPRAVRQQAHHGQRRQRLATAGLADQRQALAAVQPQVDAAQRMQRRATAPGEPHLQVADLEQRRAHRGSSLGSRRSRRPSPSRFRPSTASVIARPGASASCGASNISVWASASSRPQLACGGWVPRPR